MKPKHPTKQRTAHDQTGSQDDLIWGRHAVLEALRARPQTFHRILLAKESRDLRTAEVLELARAAQIPFQWVERGALDRLAQSQKHQGVVGVLAVKEYLDADVLLDRIEDSTILIILDQVEDPHNLGAIIRTAYCAGADSVIITKHHAVGLSRVVAKVSAGAVAHLPIARVTNLASFLERLKEAGVRIIGLDPAAARSYAECAFSGPIGLVFGGEGAGLRRLTGEQCDELVTIPMRGRIDSLNVSVAVGVVLFEILRQRASGQIT